MTLIELDSWRRDHQAKRPAEPKSDRKLTSAGILPGDGEAMASAHLRAFKNAMHRLDSCKLEADKPERDASDPGSDDNDRT